MYGSIELDLNITVHQINKTPPLVDTEGFYCTPQTRIYCNRILLYDRGPNVTSANPKMLKI